MNSETVVRMLVEIQTGRAPAREDTAEEAALREELVRECAEIRARGEDVEIPHELPDVD